MSLFAEPKPWQNNNLKFSFFPALTVDLKMRAETTPALILPEMFEYYFEIEYDLKYLIKIINAIFKINTILILRCKKLFV